MACAAASGDGYDVSVPIIIHNGSSETIGDVAHRTIQTLRDYAPACTGNTRTDVSVLCTGATTACPDPADISYWVWVKTVYADTGEVVTDWEKQVDTVCLGPAEAGIPKAAAIAGAVAREFARAVVLRAKVIAEPSGTTLVHYRTGFYTEATDYELPTLTLLGSRVRVFAHPERYDWTFGDGSTLPDGGPGARGTKGVSHEYADTGPVGAYVQVTWSGTYTVDGGPPQDVFGTAQTTGPATPLQVREARSELVTR